VRRGKKRKWNVELRVFPSSTVLFGRPEVRERNILEMRVNTMHQWFTFMNDACEYDAPMVYLHERCLWIWCTNGLPSWAMFVNMMHQWFTFMNDVCEYDAPMVYLHERCVWIWCTNGLPSWTMFVNMTHQWLTFMNDACEYDAPMAYLHEQYFAQNRRGSFPLEYVSFSSGKYQFRLIK
jgi:hypothetical protein